MVLLVVGGSGPGIMESTYNFDCNRIEIYSFDF